MKKILLLLLVLMSVACSDDVEINSPAMQGVRDSVLYRAKVSHAELKDQNRVQLMGNKDNEVLILNVSNYSEGTFLVGDDENSSAEYYNADGKWFSTLEGGEGEIVVSRIADSTFTGSFRFRANSYTDSTEVVFTKGVFYQVPITNAITYEPADPVVSTQFNCKINTVVFKTQAVGATVVNNDISGYGSTSSIVIKLIFPEDIEKGIYALADANTQELYRASYMSNGSPSFIQTGQLEITSHNIDEGSVGGTFSFSAMNKGNVEVTEGVFGFNYKN